MVLVVDSGQASLSYNGAAGYPVLDMLWTAGRRHSVTISFGLVRNCTPAVVVDSGQASLSYNTASSASGYFTPVVVDSGQASLSYNSAAETLLALDSRLWTAGRRHSVTMESPVTNTAH